jgi:hypothetical protein
MSSLAFVALSMAPVSKQPRIGEALEEFEAFRCRSGNAAVKGLSAPQ